LEERSFPGLSGAFVHPVSDESVICGNAGVGLEILEDLPEPAAVLVPYGGGGLASGIAAALVAAGSKAPVFACEVETAAPLAAALGPGAAVSASGTALALPAGPIVCVISGGNLDLVKLAEILAGRLPD